jgi:hypothetical protein
MNSTGFTVRKDPEAALDEAIASGLLSTNPNDDHIDAWPAAGRERRPGNYVGNYMYWCTHNGIDWFKHIYTSQLDLPRRNIN